MKDKQVVFILDDDKEITSLLKNFLNDKMPYLDVFSFNTCRELFSHPKLPEVCLCIIDIELNEKKKGNEVAQKLFENRSEIPYLFMSGQPYEYECFTSYKYTYDFILKPVNLEMMVNRIKVLLTVSKKYKQLNDEKYELQISIKELFDYTNIYMLVLDNDMKVRMCSYKLAKDLGFNKGSDLLNMNWKNFLTKKESDTIDNVHKHVMLSSKDYENRFREVNNKIVTRRNTDIDVKWFNSRIKNGKVYTFSIGIPYNRTVTAEDDIETIRAYWKHIIDKDKTTLRALKEVI